MKPLQVFFDGRPLSILLVDWGRTQNTVICKPQGSLSLNRRLIVGEAGKSGQNRCAGRLLPMPAQASGRLELLDVIDGVPAVLAQQALCRAFERVAPRWRTGSLLGQGLWWRHYGRQHR